MIVGGDDSSTALRQEIFAAWNFRGMKFCGFFNKFWISWHFNFPVRPKYYISRHWPKYYNLRHFSFAVVLNIDFFCAWVSSISGISEKVGIYARLNTFLSFFTHYFTKVLKTPEKLLSDSKILSFSSSEFHERSRKAKHKKYVCSLFFLRWVLKGFFSRHFDFVFWSRNFILWNFSFTVEPKKVFLAAY